MGGSPSVDTSYQDFQIKEAERARMEEEARQARINEGLGQIEAIFEGGTYTPPAATPEAVYGVDPAAQAAYDAEVAAAQAAMQPQMPFQPIVPAPTDWGASPGFTPVAPTQPTAQPTGGRPENNSPQNTFSPMLTVGPPPTEGWYTTPGAPGSNPVTYEGMDPLLEQRRQAQEGYYLPQLEKQASNAADQLVYALSRAGQLNSSTAGVRQADLSEEMALQQGDIMSKIAADVAATQTQMNQQRSAIEAGLRASGDNSAAADAALQSAVTFQQDQPELSTLGPLFAGITEGIGLYQNAAEAERIRRAATPQPINTGSSARVVGV